MKEKPQYTCPKCGSTRENLCSCENVDCPDHVPNPEKRPPLKVKKGVATDFTGLPIDPWNPANWE